MRLRRKSKETIGDVFEKLEAGYRPPPPGLWLPFGFRVIGRKQFRAELEGAADMFLEFGRILGRAEIAQQYDLDLPPDDYRLSGGLQLYPPTEEQAA